MISPKPTFSLKIHTKYFKVDSAQRCKSNCSDNLKRNLHRERNVRQVRVKKTDVRMIGKEPTGPVFMVLHCHITTVLLPLLSLCGSALVEYRPPKSLKNIKLKQGNYPMRKGSGGGADLTSRVNRL